MQDNMNKKGVLLVLFQIFLGGLLHAQKDIPDSLSWYKTDFDIVRDNIDFQATYIISKTYPEIISGTTKNFLDFQKENMGKTSLAIGPFKDKASAKLSADYYTNCNDNFQQDNKNSKDEFYWYQARIEKTKRKKILEFIRTASSEANGSLDEFKQVLCEGLLSRQLSIGPFPNQLDAEDSKFLNRILEPKRVAKKRYIDYSTFYWFKLKLAEKLSYHRVIYTIEGVSDTIQSL